MDKPRIPKSYSIIIDAVTNNFFVSVFLLPILWVAIAACLSYLADSKILDKEMSLSIFFIAWGLLSILFRQLSPFLFIAGTKQDSNDIRITSRYRRNKISGRLISIEVQEGEFEVTVLGKHGKEQTLSVPCTVLSKECFSELKSTVENIRSDNFENLKQAVENCQMTAKIQSHEHFYSIISSKGPRYSFWGLGAVVAGIIACGVLLL